MCQILQTDPLCMSADDLHYHCQCDVLDRFSTAKRVESWTIDLDQTSITLNNTVDRTCNENANVHVV